MIYVHVPFCHRKCSYCAFYSTAQRGGHDDYVAALAEEMERRRDEMPWPVKTLYFGGGTPSILSIGELVTIARALSRNFDLGELEECTIECNPEDLTDDYIKGLADTGLFNRLSIGIQSFDDTILRTLNRRHSVRQALDAIALANKHGFSNITIDLMYGLPGMSLDEWTATCRTAAALPVTHISAYSLTLEPGTILDRQVAHGMVALPSDDVIVEQYHLLVDTLEEAGYEHYEISNFCRPGYASKHNSRYWTRTPYLGLGPGAHSFSLAGGGFGVRRWNKADVADYISHHSYGEERLEESDAYNEMLMTALRTSRGIGADDIPERYKKRLNDDIQPYIGHGWIVADGSCYRPTTEGMLHADGMAAALFVT